MQFYCSVQEVLRGTIEKTLFGAGYSSVQRSANGLRGTMAACVEQGPELANLGVY